MSTQTKSATNLDITVGDVCQAMNELAPLSLSEEWDNTGLLLGDTQRPVRRLQTCLTLTDESVQEAIDEDADMVVAHHPLPFKPVRRITTETVSGRLLWQLASSGIAIYAPHTAWDSAATGINSSLASRLGLQAVDVLLPKDAPEVTGLGAGRIGSLPAPLSAKDIGTKLAQQLPAARPRYVLAESQVARVAICCGSGGSLLPAAAKAGCQLLVTGEATFHTCLEAKALGIAMVMLGHFASERFAMEKLAELLGERFGSAEVWASRRECDPVELA